MNKKKILIIISFLIGASIIQCQNLTKVTFLPHWEPQAQFAGYYAALDRGIYQKYGLDVTIITGGNKVSSSEMLKNGEVDFASLWLTNAIHLRADNVKIVNIAQVANRSGLMLVAKKSSGIKTPQDMDGKKIGIWGGDFQIQPLVFIKQYNLNVKTIMQGNSINLFFFDGIDLTSAMWYNEYHTILNSGFNPDELNTFSFADYGLNFPEEGIYCNEDFYNNNTKICKAFVEATLEGWRYAFAHQKETVEIVLRKIRDANLHVNKVHQQWMLEKMESIIFPDKNRDDFGIISKERYNLVIEKLKELGMLKKEPPYESLIKQISAEEAK